MKAITLNEARGCAGGPRRPPPSTPGAREVLVRVQASSANPADNAIAAGMLAGMGVEHEYPVILGRDYTGVVEQVGAEVTRYAVGDEVYGFLVHANPTVRDGSWAELHHRPRGHLCRPPAHQRGHRNRGCGAAGRPSPQ